MKFVRQFSRDLLWGRGINREYEVTKGLSGIIESALNIGDLVVVEGRNIRLQGDLEYMGEDQPTSFYRGLIFDADGTICIYLDKDRRKMWNKKGFDFISPEKFYSHLALIYGTKYGSNNYELLGFGEDLKQLQGTLGEYGTTFQNPLK